MCVLITSLLVQCHAPGLVATKFKTTKINFEVTRKLPAIWYMATEYSTQAIGQLNSGMESVVAVSCKIILQA